MTPLKILQITLATALIYFILGKIGLSLAIDSTGGSVTLVWPPSGMAFFAICIFGYRTWPGLAIGALVLNILNGSSLTFAIMTALIPITLNS